MDDEQQHGSVMEHACPTAPGEHGCRMTQFHQVHWVEIEQEEMI